MTRRWSWLILPLSLVIAFGASARTFVWEMDATEDQVANSGEGDGSTDSTATRCPASMTMKNSLSFALKTLSASSGLPSGP